MRVYINSKDPKGPRQLVEADVVNETKQNVWVRLLSDGSVIKRKRSRDLEKDEQ